MLGPTNPPQTGAASGPAGPLRAAPTNLNLPGASIAEDPAPAPVNLEPQLVLVLGQVG